MTAASENIIYRLDALVEELEDEGFPLEVILDSMAEFIEIVCDYE